MKKFLYFITGCVLLGFVFSFIFSQLPVFTLTGKSFLISVRDERFEAAYGLFSENYRKQHTLADFITLMQQKKLTEYSDVEWTRNVMNNEKTQGYLIGKVTTTKSEIIPIRLNFVYTKGQNLFGDSWRIEDILFIDMSQL